MRENALADIIKNTRGHYSTLMFIATDCTYALIETIFRRELRLKPLKFDV